MIKAETAATARQADATVVQFLFCEEGAEVAGMA